ncbi:MAG: hypothetical protein Q7V14_00255 [Coriobacteriia bacterium]|nr:hypothetical protein [Coriobacteriia bacterium]
MKINKPNRVVRSYTQNLNANPSDVFRLLCPVREADWIKGWKSLGLEGDEFVESFTEEYFVEFMQDWESRLNHYLATGLMLQMGAR